MSDSNLTEIVCILDKSGSMSSVRMDAIGGFNSFLKDQKSLASEARLTTILFDTDYKILYDGENIREVPELSTQTYIPSGWTALLDAIGKAINTVGARLSNTPETDRPSKVIFVILTDGAENSSKEFTKAQINNMISHQKDAYNWEFVYLAANQDAIKEAVGIGINAAQAFNYVGDSHGTRSAYDTISYSVSNFRQTGTVNK